MAERNLPFDTPGGNIVMKRFGLILSGILFLFGCGGSSNQTPTAPALAVSISPSTQTSIDQGQTVAFSATVANDSSSKGVTWTMSGTTCTGTACGTFANSTTGAATYNAPATVSASLTVTVTATSAADTSKSMSSTVVVDPPPSITTTSLANGVVGTAYSATLAATGGAGTLTWSVASGSLPAGLTLASGKISGTPTTAGPSTFTVNVADSAPTPMSATQQLGITVNPLLVISTTSLPTGMVNSAYSAPFQANSSSFGITWSVTTGSLPAGLNLSSSGTISGTPSCSGHNDVSRRCHRFRYAAAERRAKPSASRSTLPLSITTTALPSDTVGTPYTVRYNRWRNPPPYLECDPAGRCRPASSCKARAPKV